MRLHLERGRRPPQQLSAYFYLEDDPSCRPLAEALELVDERGRVVCDDFDAAVEAARARGRGERIDRALTELTPWEHCDWLTEDQKDVVRRREEAEAAVEAEVARLRAEAAVASPAPQDAEAEVASWAEGDDEEAPVADPAPAPARVGDGEPWDALAPEPGGGLSAPLRPIGVYKR